MDVAHTMEQEVLRKTSNKTRQTEIQLNIEAEDILIDGLPCPPTYEQCCRSKIWALNSIEKNNRARKCPNPCKILLWIVHLICIIIVFLAVVGLIVKVISDIHYLFCTGTVMGYIGCTIYVAVYLIAIVIDCYVFIYI